MAPKIAKTGKIQGCKASTRRSGFIYTISVILILSSVIVLAQLYASNKSLALASLSTTFPAELSAYYADNVHANLREIGSSPFAAAQPLGSTYIYHFGNSTTFTELDNYTPVNVSLNCTNATLLGSANFTAAMGNFFAYKSFVESYFTSLLHAQLNLSSQLTMYNGTNLTGVFLCPSSLGNGIAYDTKGAYNSNCAQIAGQTRACLIAPSNITVVSQKIALSCNEKLLNLPNWSALTPCAGANCSMFEISINDSSGNFTDLIANSSWSTPPSTGIFNFSGKPNNSISFQTFSSATTYGLRIIMPNSSTNCTYILSTAIFDSKSLYGNYTLPINQNIPVYLNYTQVNVNKYSQVS